MKNHLTGLTVAALLAIGSTLPGFAEDAAKTPAAPAAAPAPAASQPETPPPSVPRPSIVPKAAEPVSPAAEAEPAPAPRHRRYAHRHWHRYGSYRTAYWEPFPIYWPHIYRSQIHWNRIPWFRF